MTKTATLIKKETELQSQLLQLLTDGKKHTPEYEAAIDNVQRVQTKLYQR